eukprot:gene11247-4066_t
MSQKIVEEIKNGKLKLFPKEYKNDKETVLQILKLRPLWYKHISSLLKEDEEIVKLVIGKTSKLLNQLPKKYLKNEQFIQDYIKNPSFSMLTEEMKKNEKIMFKVCQRKPKYIKEFELSTELKIKLLEKDGRNIKHFKMKDQLNINFLKIAADQNPHWLVDPYFYNILRGNFNLKMLFCRKENLNPFFNLEKISEEDIFYAPLISIQYRKKQVLDDEILFQEKLIKGSFGAVLYFKNYSKPNKDLFINDIVAMNAIKTSVQKSEYLKNCPFMKDRKFCLMAISTLPSMMSEVPIEFQEDPEFILECTKINLSCLSYLPQHILKIHYNDERIATEILTKRPFSLYGKSHVELKTKLMRNGKYVNFHAQDIEGELVLEYLKHTLTSSYYFDIKRIQNDLHKPILKMIYENSGTLKNYYAKHLNFDDLLKDEECYKILSSIKYENFPFDQVFDHKEFCEPFKRVYFKDLLAKYHKDNIKLPKKYIDDKKLWIQHLQVIPFGELVKYHCDDLKLLKRWIMSRTGYTYLSIDHFPQQLFSDFECVMKLLKNPFSNQSAIIRKTDEKIINKTLVMELYPSALARSYTILSKEIQDDDDVLMKLCFASISELKEIEFSKECQEKMISFFPPLTEIFIDFIDKKEVILRALEYSPQIYNMIPKKFQSEFDVIKVYISSQGTNLKLFPELNDNQQIVRAAVESTPFALKFVSEEFKKSKSIVSLAVLQQPFMLNYASKELQNDFEFLLELILKNRDVYFHIKDSFQNNSQLLMIMDGRHFRLLPKQHIMLDLNFGFI